METHIERLRGRQHLPALSPVTDQVITRRSPIERDAPHSCSGRRRRSRCRRRRSHRAWALLLDYMLVVRHRGCHTGRRGSVRQVLVFRHCQEKSLVPFLGAAEEIPRVPNGGMMLSAMNNCTTELEAKVDDFEMTGRETRGDKQCPRRGY